MHWIAPSEEDAASDTLDELVWKAADRFRPSADLISSRFSTSVLALVFLRFADTRFAKRRAKIEESAVPSRRGSQVDEPTADRAEGVLFLPPYDLYSGLLASPKGGKDERWSPPPSAKPCAKLRIITASFAVLFPRPTANLDSNLLKESSKKVSEIPTTIDYGDFGRIHIFPGADLTSSTT